MTQCNLKFTEDNVIPKGYKSSDLGICPLEWDVKFIKDVAKVIDSLHMTPTFCNDGYPMVRVADIKTGNLNLSKTLKVDREVYLNFVRNYKPKKNDIVLSRVGSYGVSSFVATKDEFCIGQNTVVIKSNINAKYLYYSLNSKTTWEQIENGSFGSGYKSLSLKNINELKIYLPEVLEQGKISTALSDIDALIFELEKLIEKKQAIKAATMQQLLTGKNRLPEFALREDGTPKGYKDSELGQIPEDWEIFSFSEACTFINGRAYGLHEWEKRGTPVIRLQNLTGRGEDYYYSTLNLPAKQYCDYGDLLFMWSATFGPVIWKGQKAIYHYHIWKIVCNENVDKDFLYLTLVDMTENLKRGSSSGGTMLHVTKEIMEATLAIFPPHLEQLRIAFVLNGMIQEIELLAGKLNKLKNIKEGMMQELLTGKTRLVSRYGKKYYRGVSYGV